MSAEMTTAETAPRLSVIVPVYRDWDRLRLCLAALARQSLPSGDFEIVVVNNEDSEPPADLRAPNLKFLKESRGHSYAARNTGLAAARGAVLAFTDADCEPEPGWLAAGWASLQGEAALAGGRIEVGGDAATLAADYDRAFAFPQDANARVGRSVTANLFVRRIVAISLGGFDDNLQSGGDFEFCRRAKQAGHTLTYAPTAVVRHPPRDSLGALLRKNRRTAGGILLELGVQNQTALHRAWALKFLFYPRPRHWWRLLSGRQALRNMKLRRRVPLLALHILLQYHFAVSVLRRPPDKDRH